MDGLAKDHHHAAQSFNGHLLAATISPIAPSHYLNRLDAIYNSSNYTSVQRDVSYTLTKYAHRSIGNEDRAILETWTEIYVAYWHAIAALLDAQDPDTKLPDWTDAYESWKNLANTVIRGYTVGSLGNWTLPVLYVAGKHLRTFAIKADESKKSADGGVGVDMGGIQDDIASDFGKNEKLEDAARVINRMFTLCISDRYVALNIQVILLQRGPRLSQGIELLSRNPANGASITLPTSSSRPTSDSTPLTSLKTSSAPFPPLKQICPSLSPFPSLIL